MGIVPRHEIEQRIASFQKKLQGQDIDAALIIQRADLFYLTGSAQNAYLFVPAVGPPLLLVRKYYPVAIDHSPMAHIVEIQSAKEIPEKIASLQPRAWKRLGLELDVLPVRELEFYSALFPGAQVVDISALLHSVRMIKSQWEINKLAQLEDKCRQTFQHAGELVGKGFEGMSLLSNIELFMRRHHHQGMIRTRGFREKAQAVLILDVQGHPSAFLVQLIWVFQGYHFTGTKVFSTSDRVPALLKDLIQIHRELKHRIRPGTTWEGLRDWLTESAKAFELVGHGIGIELREPPLAGVEDNRTFLPGMVLAVGVRAKSGPNKRACLMDTGIVRKQGFASLGSSGAD